MAVLHIVTASIRNPLVETMTATFQRLSAALRTNISPTREDLRTLQNREVNLGGRGGRPIVWHFPSSLRGACCFFCCRDALF